MKPFDLQAAMRGEPVVTRDGRPYKFGAYNPLATSDHKLVGWIDGEVTSHAETGRLYGPDSEYGKPDEESRVDLFMAPRKTVVWINFYRGTGGELRTSVHQNETEANDVADSHTHTFPNHVAGPIRVEFEE